MTEDDLTSIAPRGHRSKQAEREARLEAEKRIEPVPQGEKEAATKEAKEVGLNEIERLRKRIAELERG